MYKVNLPVKHSTYQKIAHVTSRMNQGEKTTLSREYGEAVTSMACEILRHIFEVMTIDNEHTNGSGAETQKVLEQITQQLQKYMPWSVSLFGNERLLPVANYLMGQFSGNEEQKYLQFSISTSIAQQMLANVDAIQAGDTHKIPATFNTIVQILDTGVDELIKKPKTMLKFNIVADKTLNGVISMLTSLGNKRVEKTGKTAKLPVAQQYGQHFSQLISEH